MAAQTCSGSPPPQTLRKRIKTVGAYVLQISAKCGSPASSRNDKVKRMRSFVISISLYTCESWTFTAELEKRTYAFEMRCCRRLLNIWYKDHVTYEEVCRKIHAAIEDYDELPTMVNKRILSRVSHISRSSGRSKENSSGHSEGKEE